MPTYSAAHGMFKNVVQHGQRAYLTYSNERTPTVHLGELTHGSVCTGTAVYNVVRLRGFRAGCKWEVEVGQSTRMVLAASICLGRACTPSLKHGDTSLSNPFTISRHSYCIRMSLVCH